MSRVINTMLGPIQIINVYEFIGTMSIRPIDNGQVIRVPIIENNVIFNADNYYPYSGRIINREVIPITLGSDQLPMITQFSKKKILVGNKNNWATLVDTIIDEAREIAKMGRTANCFVEIAANQFLLTDPKYYSFYVNDNSYAIVCTVPEMDIVYSFGKTIESHMPSWF